MAEIFAQALFLERRFPDAEERIEVLQRWIGRICRETADRVEDVPRRGAQVGAPVALRRDGQPRGR
jgi:hypothetical protein